MTTFFMSSSGAYSGGNVLPTFYRKKASVPAMSTTAAACFFVQCRQSGISLSPREFTFALQNTAQVSALDMTTQDETSFPLVRKRVQYIYGNMSKVPRPPVRATRRPWVTWLTPNALISTRWAAVD